MTIYNLAIEATKKYNKIRYFKISNNKIDILFAIKTDIDIILCNNKFYQVKIESDLYLLSSKGIGKNNTNISPKQRIENWTLEAQGFKDIKSASFGCSLFLPSYLYGYGIGKVLLNQLIEIGKILVPQASISLKLAPSQPSDDNIERRDRFYKKFGFKLTYENEANKFLGGSGYIERIDKLKTYTMEQIQGIEEVSIFKKVHEFNQLEYDLVGQTDINKNLLISRRESWEKCYQLEKYKYITYILAIIVIFLMVGILK